MATYQLPTTYVNTNNNNNYYYYYNIKVPFKRGGFLFLMLSLINIGLNKFIFLFFCFLDFWDLSMGFEWRRKRWRLQCQFVWYREQQQERTRNTKEESNNFHGSARAWIQRRVFPSLFSCVSGTGHRASFLFLAFRSDKILSTFLSFITTYRFSSSFSFLDFFF